MFKLIGLLVAVYVVYAARAGKVVAKAAPGARVVSRDESPEYFWIVIVVYAGLSVALLTVF